MSDLKARLDELAGRGTPRGFDAVFGAARRDADAELSGSGVHADVDADVDADTGANTGADIDAEVIPFVTAEARRVRPRRRYHSLVSAAGLSAMLLVGLLAISAVVGSSAGASTPDGAVRRLADALRNEDVLEASDVMAPSELARLHGTLDKAAAKAAEFRLVQNAGAPLTGIDIDVKDLDLSVANLADGYAKVTVDSGTISAETKKAKFSPLLQKALRESGDNRAEADLASLVENAPTFVMAVREDGKWYVSAAYTALEYVRVINNATAPVEYGAGRAAAATLGADSPEAAVDGAVRALVAGDWDRVSALAAPGELPLYDYRKVLAEVTAKDRLIDADATVTSGESTVVRRDGDTADVVMRYEGTTPDGPWSLDGGCLTTPFRDYSPDSSLWVGLRAQGTALVGDEPGAMPSHVSSCISKENVAVWGPFLLGGMQTPIESARTQTVRVVRQDGRWFVSPVGTAFDVIDGAIDMVNRDNFYGTWLNLPQEMTPEGAAVLGRPTAISSEGRGLNGEHVYTFEGQKGQELVALVGSLGQLDLQAASGDIPYGGMLRMYAPDGTPVAEGVDPWHDPVGAPVILPADGTYRVVVVPYGTIASEFTIWNAADAPEAVKKQRERANFGAAAANFGPSSNPTPENPDCTDLYDGMKLCSDGASIYVLNPDGTRQSTDVLDPAFFSGGAPTTVPGAEPVPVG